MLYLFVLKILLIKQEKECVYTEIKAIRVQHNN